MKKFRKLLPVMALVFGVGLAFATQSSNSSESKTDASEMLHWFDLDENYLGEKTQAQQQSQCGTPAIELCARGYESIDSNQEPVGSVVATTTKQ
ncbi:DUF6520 family protein [Negadavirga shengliensis]|uniref:DUF6520 family protein n=1 Tax=Negadavirga shengliensis TaxID=1389218 RepID=A0ABV9T0X7_9BACT